MENIVQAEFNGSSVSFTSAGWFNATQAAEKYGKLPAQWLRLPTTKSYLSAFQRKYGEITHLKTVRGRHHGGTWLHPKLAVRFAQWLSDDFAVWCDAQIDNLIRSEVSRQNFIPQFLRESAGHWTLRFNPSYYKALSKITGTTYTGHSGGTPAIFGQITDKWVYKAILPKDVYQEIHARRENSQKMHQWLTDGGQHRLNQHVTIITLLAQSSSDLKDFEARCMQAFGTNGQLQFVFPLCVTA